MMTGQNGHQNLDEENYAGQDAGFDLRQGIRILIVVITIMVIITLICTWLERR